MGLPDTFLGWVMLGLVAFLLYRNLFIPTLSHEVRQPVPLDSEDSVRMLACLADCGVAGHNRLEILRGGDRFYPAELQALGEARSSIHIESYIFQGGRTTADFVAVLCERAAEGVQVRLLLDAVGSAGMALRRTCLNQLREAGCHVYFYHPLHINTLERINIRTHREIIVVDGCTAFVGGAGFADHWFQDGRARPRWRDMMVRLEGSGAAAVQGVFLENWLEASGEVVSGVSYFPVLEPRGQIPVLVVASSSRGRSSRTRILHQVLLASATRSIQICTPYFLPDSAIRRELLDARGRGVAVKIITAGRKSDHTMTRRAGQRLYGPLLRAGVEIFEYRRAMFHVKLLVVDACWIVVGTTNFDHRSFSINDEINLAFRDSELSRSLSGGFQEDAAQSEKITYESWRQRSIARRIHEQLSRLLERQQ